jgi:hypothetical protein
VFPLASTLFAAMIVTRAVDAHGSRTNGVVPRLQP